MITMDNGDYYINHAAPGADRFRYSGDFKQTWSDWADYETTTKIDTKRFEGKWWKGQHVIVQYWSRIAGSSATEVHADYDYTGQRRFPQLMARGAFNNWGYDSGTNADLENDNGVWSIPLMSSWPDYVQLNVYGYDDFFYGDTDGDGVIDRLPPNAQSPNYLNMSTPPSPHLSWTLVVDDKSGIWTVTPRGHYIVGVIMFALLLAIPPITAFAAAAIFRYSFYAIKVNKWGIKPSKETSYFPIGDKKAASMNEKAVIPVSEKLGKHHHTPDKIIGWQRTRTRGGRSSLPLSSMRFWTGSSRSRSVVSVSCQH
jgi:alpha-1,3-glucan synthase